MKVLTFDFETYYDKEYSLSTMPMWAYINDPRFEVIGVSVAEDDQPAVSFTGTFLETHRFLSQFDWDNSAACAHNAAFDLAILKWKFGISPKLRLDTWSMCNALHGSSGGVSLKRMAEMYGIGRKGDERESAIGKRREDFTAEEMNAYMTYCGNDSELCYKLLLAVSDRFSSEELRIIDWTLRCYSEPTLQLDKELLAEELAAVRKRKAAANKAAGITDPSLLRKDEVLADMLREFGVEPPGKVTPKGNIKYAFAKSDVQFLELREHEDDRVVALVDARLEAKSSIEETRIESLLQLSERGRGLPFPLTYFGASTGRWSAWDDINLQNLPKKGRIREGIIAPKDHLVVAADLSQIELRILSWSAGQQDVLDLLANGGDVYSYMAEGIYGYPVNKKDNPTERFAGKTAELGCGFGCGAPKFLMMIEADCKRYGINIPDLGPDFAKRVVNTYRQRHPKVVSFWNEAKRAIEHMLNGGSGYIGKYEYRGNQVFLPRGIPLTYNNMRRDINPKTGEVEVVYDRYNQKKRVTSRVKLWHGLLVENIVQATARDVFVSNILRVENMGYRCVGTVHDELLVVVHKDQLEQALVDIATAMRTPPEWLKNCPLDCEINYGANYLEAK